MSHRSPESTCRQCGKQFWRPPSLRAKYCSPACYAASKIGTIRGPNWRQPSGRPRGARETRSCLGCGRAMEVLASQARQRLYCSHECYLGTRAGKPRRRWAHVEMRACLVCGKVFEVGGAGRPPRRQRLCSDACQRKVRYRHGAQAQTMTKDDAIYLAAFVDGEGSIMLGARNETASVILSVSNTKRVVLDWMVEATAVGAVQRQRDATHKTAACFFWRCTGDAAESVLRQIASHLKLKRVQAELAIAFQERLRTPALKADRTWQHESLTRMQALNRRGPT